MDRRRGSPPPPPPRRGRDAYDGPPMGRRRSRSPSDRYPRGRSPPPFKRRRDDDAYHGRFGRGDDYMGRGPARGGPQGPPRGGYSDPYYEGRRGSPDRDDVRPDRSQGPLTFKQFIQKQKDDPSPEEAQQRYKEYLVEYHGGEIKAEFVATKDKARVRELYDPRSFEKALAKRNEEASVSRTQLLQDVEAGVLQPSAPGFNQGAGDLAPKAPAAGEDGAAKEEPPSGFAPAFCWRASRVAADLVMARRLTRRLDHEKGFADDNPLLPAKTEEAQAAQAGADAQDAQDAAAAKEEGKAAPTGGARRYVEVHEDAPVVDEENYQEVVGKLDLLLTYLWKVHGIDYYAGYELTASEFPQRLTACRLLRGPKPEGVEKGEGTDPASAQGAGDMAVDEHAANNGEGATTATTTTTQEGAVTEQSKEEGAEGVEVCWNKRIADGDPLEAQCLRKKVEQRLDEWIEKQIICYADNKWGSHVSPKMFMARKFVVKHIRTKHEDKVQVEKEKILDELYFEAFKAAKLEEEERAKQEEEANKEAGGEDAGAMEEDDPEGRRDGKGGRGGRGGGRGGRGGGGGGGGGRMNMMGGMMMDPMALMHMPPMMPFLPMMPPGMLPMMPPAMLMGAMRGGRGGRMGGGRGGRGGRGMREYYDLDNPQNNRAILDYGDL